MTVHFLNLYFQWSVIRSDLAQKPAFQSPEYTFIGFSPFHKEEIEAARRLPNAAPTGRIFAYFDLLHPAVFMVWNNGGAGDFFDLGPVLAAFPAGASQAALSPGSVFRLRQGQQTMARNFGGSIVGSVWARHVNAKNASRGNGRLSGSFIVKPASAAPSIKLPHLVYFYLPLAVIVILILYMGTAMAAAFFYYAGMFFFFDFQNFFVTVPLAWLLDALGVDLPDPWGKVLAAALALSFLAAAVFGLWRWKDREMPPNGKWLVWFFILLPFFLFF
ncbi:MAG TPA: hypothetical protein VLQ89_00055 [Candidatus Binatia bacterium]|nr:hypothetical protein [Candidatus Binatia bacterium]